MTTLRMTTAGESHGPAEVCVISGIPAGLHLDAQSIDLDLARRQRGYGRGGRMAIEKDRCRILSGVRLGTTLGTPIALLVENQDHANWTGSMAPQALPPGQDGPEALTIPRPGHADFAGMAKYGHHDMRNVLERASARETVGRVAGGAVCRRLLADLGVTVRGRVIRIGEVAITEKPDLGRPDLIDWEAVEASPVACDAGDVARLMQEAIDRARAAGESLGGVVEVWCWGTCPGLGGYANMGDRLDGRLFGALGSIPAIKAVEIGRAFENAGEPGSRVHDPFVLLGEADARVEGEQGNWLGRTSNNAGGLEGGMTTGQPLVVRAVMKPIPTLTTPLPSVDVSTMRPVEAHYERSDVTAVPAACVVAEAMVAYVLAGAYLDKFGGDSLADLKQAVALYEEGLKARGLWRRS